MAEVTHKIKPERKEAAVEVEEEEEKPERSGIDARRQMREEHGGYYEIAEAVAARLGYEYGGLLFSYPEIDQLELERERAAAEAKLGSARARLKAAESGSAHVGAGEGEITGQSYEELRQNIDAIERFLEELTGAPGAAAGAPAPGAPRFRRCPGRRRPRLGSRDPYSVPLDAAESSVPSTLLVENIDHSAAQVAMRLGMRRLSWRDLWYGADDVVRRMFAELVAANISAVSTRVTGGMHDRLKVSSADQTKKELLDAFETLRVGRDGLYHFGADEVEAPGDGAGQALADSIARDPVGAALKFAGYPPCRC